MESPTTTTGAPLGFPPTTYMGKPRVRAKAPDATHRIKRAKPRPNNRLIVVSPYRRLWDDRPSMPTRLTVRRPPVRSTQDQAVLLSNSGQCRLVFESRDPS